MDREIDVISEFPILFAFWDGWDDEIMEKFIEEYGGREDDREEIITEERIEYEQFISNLKRKYNKIRINISSPNDTVIIFPQKFNSLKAYVNMIKEPIDYLENKGIPWQINDLSFSLDDRENGIIRFDQEKKIITIYYVDPDDNEFRKEKIQIGKMRKI